MKKRPIFSSVVILTTLLLAGTSRAGDGFTQNDRELLIELKVRFGEIDKRFEQVDRGFEQLDTRIGELREDMNKRFEHVDKRFEAMREDMNKRFDQIYNVLWILATIFTAITVSTIGFAVWDRRTMVRPFESKVKELGTRIEELDKGKLERLISALRELAKVDVKLHDILRRFNLM